jgi:pimeloyl-ACP methyl ester carboxylesterase
MELSFTNRQVDPVAWQAHVRSKFLELIYYDQIPPLDWKVLQSDERQINGLTQRRHLVQFGEREPQPIYECLPADGQWNGMTLVALHGHGDSVFDNPMYDYLWELPGRGYRCVTPILFGTMERQTHSIKDRFVTEYCREWLLEADALGVSLLALRLLDARLAYRFALSLDGVEPEKTGCAGLSMGGQLALYLAAIETDIAFSVSAGFLSTFEGSLIRARWCHCYSIRDWPRWFDMPDLAGCIAPRPLLALKGDEDPCFTDKNDVLPVVKRVEEIYTALGAAGQFQYQTYPAEHLLNSQVADEWIREVVAR